MTLFVNSALVTYYPYILFVERNINSITTSKHFKLATYMQTFQMQINGMKNVESLHKVCPMCPFSLSNCLHQKMMFSATQ